jgi:hypothetical protein
MSKSSIWNFSKNNRILTSVCFLILFYNFILKHFGTSERFESSDFLILKCISCIIIIGVPCFQNRFLENLKFQKSSEFKDSEISKIPKISRNLRKSNLLDIQQRYIQKFFQIQFGSRKKIFIYENKSSKFSNLMLFYISKSFWRTLEYTVAEICINLTFKIRDKNQNYDSYIFNTNEVKDFISEYSEIFHNESKRNEAVSSLYSRIMLNLNHIKMNEDVKNKDVEILKLIFKDIPEFIPEDIPEDFWEYDLVVNFKSLQKLNYHILQI